MNDHKLYPHITGLRGNEGEDPATLAVVAILDPSPHYPDCARIIVGSPKSSESKIDGFSCGPNGAVDLAQTLMTAAADVEDALAGEKNPPVKVTDGAEPGHAGIHLHPFKFTLPREHATELHRQLGEWLEARHG